MGRFIKAVALTVSIAIMTGCGSNQEPVERILPPADASAGDFEVVPCVHLSDGVEFAAECGTLVVPENRTELASRLIAVPVVRIPAPGGSPAEPIFFLEGGPGATNLKYNRVAWYHDNHDIVLVGYRGVDGSVYLGCPEVTEAMGSGLPMLGREGMAAVTSAYAACAERLTAAGIDLDGYTVLEVVDDIEAARRALGYERINLESESYGTRLAQIYSWRFPDRVARNAMVGVNPPGRFWWDGEILEQQILRYAELCAGDDYCSSRTDDLAATMGQVLEDMPDRWLFFRVDRDAVLFATFLGLYTTSGAASVFDVWLAAADGDFSGMALITAVLTAMIPADMVWGDLAAKGGSADYDFDPTADYVAEITPGPHLLGSPASSLGWAAAPGWPANKIPDEYRIARPSSVETLMLSGTLDVSTPEQNARLQLLPLLDNGEQVVLVDFAHNPDLYGLQPDATRHLLTTFFATGAVDASRYTPHTVNFKPSWGFPFIAKLALGGAALALIFIAVLIALSIRLARRFWLRRRSAIVR